MFPKTMYGTDHNCEFKSKSYKQFDLWKPDKIFLFIALEAILCSEAEPAGHVHI
jgi:hypothetical protein